MEEHEHSYVSCARCGGYHRCCFDHSLGSEDAEPEPPLVYSEWGPHGVLRRALRLLPPPTPHELVDQEIHEQIRRAKETKDA